MCSIRARWRRGRWPTTSSGARSTAPGRCTPSPLRADRPGRRGRRSRRSCWRSSNGTWARASAPNSSTSRPTTSASACGSPPCSVMCPTRASPCCVTGPPWSEACPSDLATMVETLQQLLRNRMDDDGVAMRHGERTWTWREHLAEAAAEASALIAQMDPTRPVHVGALLGNTPAMLRSMAAAALGGYVPCGINTTRRGDGLAADIGKPLALVLATPEQPDDTDNILRAAFGNE